jgi:hypothetical protein
MQKWILNNQKLIKTSMKDKMELENLTMDEI